MEFGKLESLDGVDFNLPPDPTENERLLSSLLKRGTNPKIWLGATGWSMREWVGTYYPKGAKPGEYLSHYARQFNTIEGNTTYYRIPDAATIDNWRAATPADFRFCPKVPQSVSHLSDFSQIGRDLPLFTDALLRLGDRMGCAFLQLAPGFSPKRTAAIIKFLRIWPKALPLAIEVRHEDFFSSQKTGRLSPEAENYFQLIEAEGVATCISDTAGRRDVVYPRLTTSKILVRFVSNSLHPTDFGRADDWAKRLADWFARGLTEVFFFAHAPDNLRAPEVAMMLDEKFRAAIPGLDIRGPKPIATLAVQTSLF